MSHAPLVRLEDCCEIVSGATPSTSVKHYWGGGIAWATPKDLSDLDAKYIDETPQTLTEEGYRNCSAKIMPAGSVLFSSRAPIGHVAINRVPMCTNQGFKSFVPDPKRVSADYLYYWLKANKKYLQSLGNGATFKEVSKATVAEVKVPLPSMQEQRRIAAILDKADALRAKRREAIAKLDQLLQSVFLEAFGDPIANKRSYPLVSLADAVEQGRPITYGILKPGPDIADGIPYIRVVDIKDGGVSIATVKRTSPEIAYSYRRSEVHMGDVLLSIRGHVGRVGVVPAALDKANITQDTARISVSREFEPTYIAGLLNSQAVQAHMRQFTRGAAVQGINLKDVREIPVPVPAYEAQVRYATAVQKLADLKARSANQLSCANSLFHSLQQRAFASGF